MWFSDGFSTVYVESGGAQSMLHLWLPYRLLTYMVVGMNIGKFGRLQI